MVVKRGRGGNWNKRRYEIKGEKRGRGRDRKIGVKRGIEGSENRRKYMIKEGKGGEGRGGEKRGRGRDIER